MRYYGWTIVTDGSRGWRMRDEAGPIDMGTNRPGPEPVEWNCHWFSLSETFAGFANLRRWRDVEGTVHYPPGETCAIEEFLTMSDRNLQEQGYLDELRRSLALVAGEP